MRSSVLTEAQAIATLRYHLKNRQAKAKRLAKKFEKIEKLQPRGFLIASIVADTQERLKWIKANFVGIDVSLRIDTEEHKHLTGKVKDKTAGRNQLGLRSGK